MFSVSHTTRLMRSGERDDVDYHFVDVDEFKRMIDAGSFLEWAVYGGNHYGTSWAAIRGPLAEGRDVLLEIEVKGARQVRERLETARLVFLLPPSVKALECRLQGRATDSSEQIAARLQIAESELAAVEEFEFAVVNDKVERCVEDLRAILRAAGAGDLAELKQRFDPRAAAERFRYSSASP
jgi:guanylate kinase